MTTGRSAGSPSAYASRGAISVSAAQLGGVVGESAANSRQVP